MVTVALKEATSKLDELLEEAAKGQEVLIQREDGQAFKIVASSKRRGGLGKSKGKIWMADDFKTISEGFEEAERLAILEQSKAPQETAGLWRDKDYTESKI
jgi:antitoxin (DNA-binding transcriptional repressor) of toxin-antitoxin stability system